MSKAVQISDGTFEEEVLKSDVPVVVDFWAPWCGPCKMISPILEDFAEEYDGKLKIAKLDVDQNPKISSQYKIMSIPALLFFKDGELVEQVIGALPKAQLQTYLSKIL